MSWGSAASTANSLPVSVLDRPAVFETMRVYSGRIAAFDRHLRRLAGSAKTAGIGPIVEKTLAARTLEAVERSGCPDAIARLSVHAPAGRTAITGCSVRPFAGFPRDWYDRGARITTASVRRADVRSSCAQVKGNDYVNAIGAILNVPKKLDAAFSADPMFLTAAGEVSETTVANILIIRDGALWTPPAVCGILLGVTRGLALECARSLGLEVRETPFTRHDLFNAAEVFLTNAAVEILPVIEADGRRIGSGRPGPWSARLREAYLKASLARR